MPRPRLSDEQQVQRREERNARQREARRNLTQEQRQRAAEAQRARRLNMSENQREHVAETQRARRLNMSENQREHVAETQRARRQNMTNEERLNRNSARRERAIARRRDHRMNNTPIARQDLNDNDVPEHDCGTLENQCTRCGAKYFLGERTKSNKIYTTCCMQGKVDDDVIPHHLFEESFEKLLRGQFGQSLDLYLKTKQQSNQFFDNIRAINSSLAFASLGAKIAKPPGHGPYCFRIHGAIYHRAGTLHPDNGKDAQYAQLYIMDADEAADIRARRNQQCDENLLKELSRFIANRNPLAEQYKLLHQVEREENERAAALGLPMPQISMAIKSKTDRTQHAGRYNLPTVNEIAVIFRNKDGEPPNNWDILVHLNPTNDPNGAKTKRIPIYHTQLDAMIYPIFFPLGGEGWHPDLKVNDTETSSRRRSSAVQNPQTRLTLMMFYSYRLQIRNTFNPLLHGRKLTQQYFVDAYVRMEADRLQFARKNQDKLRADSYSSLRGFLDEDQRPDEGVVPGRPVILPSSFQGSPRNMQQGYQDNMATVKKFGNPDLFITMTCNPNWKEIQDNLDGTKREFRPDLVARVFNLKLNEFLDDVTNKDIFGKVAAYTYVIEFQKRGLPHAHILLILDRTSKIEGAEAIDRVVSAELPDPITQPRLFSIVTKHMLHGPCGDINRDSPCMTCVKQGCSHRNRENCEKECTKKFPKSFQEATDPDRNGYVLYRRREMEPVQIGNNIVDNRWVVPYNPYLLYKYNCHINVEISNSVLCVKYIYKYVYKGHDCANVEFGDINDEIKNFLESRYVSSPEAAWRIFGFPMHGSSHTIYRLQVHLEDQQLTYFQENNVARAVSQAEHNETTLTGWFKLNQNDQEARNYYYYEIPEYYRWNKEGKPHRWTKRKRDGQKTIGRMYAVSMKDTERYFLRVLLLHVKGATSYEHLRTVVNPEGHSVVYDTFHEAAKARGLADDPKVWQDTLNDAAIVCFPKQLRDIFAYILIYCCPENAIEFWETHKQALSEDYQYRHADHNETCVDCEYKALRDIQDILRLSNKRLSDFQLTDPPRYINDMVETGYDSNAERERGEQMVATLNNEQRTAFDAIVQAIDNGSRNCFFIDGPGGSGKTYLYETLISTLRGRDATPLACASTGIAGNLLPNGRTYHSLFGLGPRINESTTSQIKGNCKRAADLRNGDLFVWDEATMASCHALKSVDKLMRDINRQNEFPSPTPLGGKVFVLGGDFRQTLPIVPHGSRTAIVETSLKSSEVWRHFQQFRLINNNRSVDPEFSKWLLALGEGTLENQYDLGEDIVEIPEKHICQGSLLNEIFGATMRAENVHNFANKFILAPKNKDCDELNKQALQKLEGEAKTYLSLDSIKNGTPEENFQYPIEFLNSLTPSGMPLHELTLKKGAIVILLRNLRKGLCNGTRLIVRNMYPNLIQAEVLTGSSKGELIFLPRIVLDNDVDLPVVFARRQFPVKLAFAMTINKSQGQTADKVGIYLPLPVFGHGQLYVAFSRAKRADDVLVQIQDTPEQGKLLKDDEDCSKREKVFTKNVVYREIFEER